MKSESIFCRRFPLDVSTFNMGKYLMKELISEIENKTETRKIVVSSYVERESVGKCKDIN